MDKARFKMLRNQRFKNFIYYKIFIKIIKILFIIKARSLVGEDDREPPSK